MEHCADGTVEAMLAFQKEYDWDFMKINPRADYHTEDWGLRSEWSHQEFRKHEKVAYPVETAADWRKITPHASTPPSLAEHLTVVSRIRKKTDRELPILMTVFTPLAIAGRLIKDKQRLVEQLRNEPERIHGALRAITVTFTAYVSDLRNAGADGIFFATLNWASSDMITWDEYLAFGVPYDLEVMKAAESDAINLLHVCASNNYLDKLAKIEGYGCQLFNWDSADPSNRPIDRAGAILGNGKVAVGGVDQEGWLLHSDADEIGCMIDKIKDHHSPTSLILGPGCVVPPEVPAANLHAIRMRL
jgi:uroporphyrinogen decarboxylase